MRMPSKEKCWVYKFFTSFSESTKQKFETIWIMHEDHIEISFFWIQRINILIHQYISVILVHGVKCVSKCMNAMNRQSCSINIDMLDILWRLQHRNILLALNMFSYTRKGRIFFVMIANSTKMSIFGESSKEMARNCAILVYRCITTNEIATMQDKCFMWICSVQKYVNLCCNLCGNQIYIATNMSICQEKKFHSSESIRKPRKITIFLSILHRLCTFFCLLFLSGHCQAYFTPYLEDEGSRSLKERYIRFKRNTFHDKISKN